MAMPATYKKKAADGCRAVHLPRPMSHVKYTAPFKHNLVRNDVVTHHDVNQADQKSGLPDHVVLECVAQGRLKAEERREEGVVEHDQRCLGGGLRALSQHRQGDGGLLCGRELC